MSEQQQAGPKPGACTAFGCPLPGSTRGFGSGDGWWCFLHAGGECDLQATTEKIHQRQAVIRGFLKASRLADWSKAATLTDFFAGKGRADLAPTADEQSSGARYQPWLFRVRRTLQRECFVGLSTSDDFDVRPQKQEGPQSLANLAKTAPHLDRAMAHDE
jgi:hypothetical protein